MPEISLKIYGGLLPDRFLYHGNVRFIKNLNIITEGSKKTDVRIIIGRADDSQ